jgi:beta-xylosidase
MIWGDQGDGTYRNPILPTDFSDPDAIRVGDDFYMVASDFHYMGMQVLHSRDLVNWEIIDQVFERLEIDKKYDEMKGYGQGTWAPSLRHHEGRFYLFVCTPYDGLFMWHTKDPAGPWSHMYTVKSVARWEDPCPFWDEDGKAYLIRSNKGAGPLILHKMSSDGTHLLDNGKEIYKGKGSEGPKLHKRKGYYYISMPEGGVALGGQTVLRSKKIYGPYERKQVLPDGSPHQGALIELANGQWWFLCFKSTGYLGRITHLMPVTWGKDDWPIFGDGEKTVASAKKPDVGRQFPILRPQTVDEFDSLRLSPNWQWNHNPIDDAWSLTQRPGWLRLRGRLADGLATARNTLTQKLWDDRGVIDVKFEIGELTEGQKAGLTFISGDQFGWVGVTRENGIAKIIWTAGDGPPTTANTVFFRAKHEGEWATFFYSLDGYKFTDTGFKFQLKFEFWKGARPGLFCYGPGGGWVDVGYWRYRPGE